MKIELFSYDTIFFLILFHERRLPLPPKGRPHGGSVPNNSKTSARHASKEALRRGFIMYITIFMVQEKILQIHARFSRAEFFPDFILIFPFFF